jgi:hypothetical protein
VISPVSPANLSLLIDKLGISCPYRRFLQQLAKLLPASGAQNAGRRQSSDRQQRGQGTYDFPRVRVPPGIGAARSPLVEWYIQLLAIAAG